jgi:cell division protein FtsZ
MADDIKIMYAGEKATGAVLKVVGVGGAGNNAINSMIDENMQGVEFIAVNTDMQVLAKIKEPAMRLQIGDKITHGLGAGANPEVGERAALEDTDAIIDALGGAHMVFITSGMGGGTGTGASHIIANHASSMGILTVGVVTKPFHFEREKRMKVAEEGIRKLKESVDAIIVIPNQKLLDLGDPNITLKNAFKKADDVLLQAVRGISDIINGTGFQNVDFADVKTIMVGKGIALMGTGEARGENRAEEATRKALNSPLLDNVSINGASGVLYNITASDSLTLSEVQKISDLITCHADSEANVKYGVISDETANDVLRVTVIATGFKENAVVQPQTAPPRQKTPSAPGAVISEPAHRQPTPQDFFKPHRASGGSVDLSHYVNDSSLPSMTHGPEDIEDPFDSPAFLRRHPSRKS